MINFPSSFLKTLLVNAFVLYCMNIMLWKGKPVDSSYVYSVYCLHSCVLRGVCRKRIIQSFFSFEKHYMDALLRWQNRSTYDNASLLLNLTKIVRSIFHIYCDYRITVILVHRKLLDFVSFSIATEFIQLYFFWVNLFLTYFSLECVYNSSSKFFKSYFSTYKVRR